MHVVFCALGLGHCISYACMCFGALISSSMATDLGMTEVSPFWFKSIEHCVFHMVHCVVYAMSMQIRLMHAYSMQDNISMQQYEQQLAYTMQMSTSILNANGHGILNAI